MFLSGKARQSGKFKNLEMTLKLRWAPALAPFWPLPRDAAL